MTKDKVLFVEYFKSQRIVPSHIVTMFVIALIAPQIQPKKKELKLVKIESFCLCHRTCLDHLNICKFNLKGIGKDIIINVSNKQDGKNRVRVYAIASISTTRGRDCRGSFF